MELWGRNIFDRPYIDAATCNVGIFNQASYTPPREYGAFSSPTSRVWLSLCLGSDPAALWGCRGDQPSEDQAGPVHRRFVGALDNGAETWFRKAPPWGTGTLPKIVDAEQRREMIAKVIEEMALTTGVEEIRVREVAERVGCSTNAIYHYFRSKAEMLIHAQKLGRRRAVERVMALPDDASFVERIDVLLPLSEDRRREWHTWFLLWGMPQTDPSVAAERLEGAVEANDLVASLVRDEIEAGRMNKGASAEDVAYDIMLILNGIASLAAPDPDNWPPERQQATLRRHLKGLGFRL